VSFPVFLAVVSAFIAGLLLTAGLYQAVTAEGRAARSRLRRLATRPAAEESRPAQALRRQDGAYGGRWSARTALELERAGLQLRVSEYVVLRMVAALLGFLIVALITGGSPLGLVAAVAVGTAGFVSPAFYVHWLKARRLNKLDSQLEEMILMVSNSLKAGFGLLQSLDQAAQQLAPPMATELLRVIRDTNVGSTLEDALTAMSERVGSYDLDMIVTAIVIQRTVGGNLAEILDNVAHTIRERVRIKGEINTLTAQKKLSGIILVLLPVSLVLLFFAVNPDYMSLLFTTAAGRIMLAGAILLDLLGVFTIRRILAVDV